MPPTMNAFVFYFACLLYSTLKFLIQYSYLWCRKALLCYFLLSGTGEGTGGRILTELQERPLYLDHYSPLPSTVNGDP